MSFQTDILRSARPKKVRDITLPRRAHYFASPSDWRNEILYFLLPDRFSDGQETAAKLLDRSNIAGARPANFDLKKWAQSGGEWQGGTLKGIESKLPYLKKLGVTCLWVGPIFKQRRARNTYHGYGIQDFLEVDPHFGTRQDLVDLVAKAHEMGLRVILDIVFNHSGQNWNYQNGVEEPPYLSWPNFYPRGDWLDAGGNPTANIAGDDDGVWPQELQGEDSYSRAGYNGDSLGKGDLNDDHAEHKRADFIRLRDFNFDKSANGAPNETLTDLARCYKYWIALTDCDGFRLDTLKHVPQEIARNFCGTVKEFAANLGKTNFFLVGGIAGSADDAGRYLDALELNLNAALDIGEMRPTLTAVAKELQKPNDYLSFIKEWTEILGSHRNSGPRHVTILDDHDHVSGEKVRFSSGAGPHQVVAGVAIQLFSLGIPCVYYGTEQALAGPEKAMRDGILNDYGRHFNDQGHEEMGNDKYLREAMFGPTNARLPDNLINATLPGFGPFGTTGRHCFDDGFEVFKRIAALVAVRQSFPVARYGRQYAREVADPSNATNPFLLPESGGLIAWSRILDDEELVCIINSHGGQNSSGNVLVARELNKDGEKWKVLANTAETAAGGGYAGANKIGDEIAVQMSGATPFLAIRDVEPSEILILTNRP